MTEGTQQTFTENDFGSQDIVRLAQTVWRRRGIVLGAIFIALCWAAVFLYLAPHRYMAVSKILIEPDAARTPPAATIVIPQTGPNNAALLTEAEILRSRALIREVTDMLDLAGDPEFNPALSPFDLTALSGGPAPDKSAEDKFLSLSLDRAALPEERRAYSADRMNEIYERVASRLTVAPVPGSDVLEVRFEADNPTKAALIANTVVQSYIRQRLARKAMISTKYTRWLDRRLETLNERLRAAEQAVEEFRAAHNLVRGTGTELNDQQIADFGARIAEARAESARMQARVEQMRQLAAAPQNAAISSDLMESPLIRDLKAQEATLAGTVSELSARYGDRHPRLIGAREELDRIRARMRDEATTVLRALENDARLAEARVAALQTMLAGADRTRQADSGALIRLRELERTADSNRQILNNFLDSMNRSEEQEKLLESGVRVLSAATPPPDMSYPNAPLFGALALIAGLFSGLGLALLMEALNRAVRSPAELEAVTGAPCFGLIPAVTGRDEAEIGAFPVRQPAAPAAEAVRSLLAQIRLRFPSPQQRGRVVAVTSSFSGEGKTTLSVWLARAAARSGQRVIVIDCDLRRPRLHRLTGQGNDRALADYLSGHQPITDIVSRDDLTPAQIVTARPMPNSALDLLSGQRMAALVQGLRPLYDLVILDCPAALPVADARVLGMLADQILYAVRWNRTSRDAVLAGLKQFAELPHRPLACVLTHVDLRKQAAYGYTDAAYYYDYGDAARDGKAA